MTGTITQKIIKQHLVEGEMTPGEEIALNIDQTITQDATGTMAYLQFEKLEIPRVKTKRSISFIDHNTLQGNFMNADDHLYLQSVAAKYGIYLSKPGNGICHQLNLERFSVPGWTMIGSDSHTPTAGGVGMFAVGVGGLNVAVTMGGMPYRIKMPKVVGVKLTGKLSPWVSAKDVILEMLKRVGVKGGKGKVYEYYGPGVKTLSVPERATITNMGTEMGATTSIFPSDEVTKQFFKAQGREDEWSEVKPDENAEYDEHMEIDLSKVEPLVAKPHSPGNVVTVKELEGMDVQQVAIGSCTNSSYKDLATVAQIIKGKQVDPKTSLVISFGSRQVLMHLIESGELNYLVSAGARLLECTCGPCIGMGQAPPSKAVSVRTFNRNFEGRSGTKDAQLYLVSPETAAATALKGVLTDPRDLDAEYPTLKMPSKFILDDSLLIPPIEDGSKVKIARGPNIKELPHKEALPETVGGQVLIKVEDDISTDHIMPAGAKILPLRSNVPAMSEYVFSKVDPDFAARAKEKNGGVIVGGENYGQGSSREHAALCPMFLGVKAVLAKSFARIHEANLVNFGILPLTFENNEDYDDIEQGDELEIPDVKKAIEQGKKELVVKNKTKNSEYKVKHGMTGTEMHVMLKGGLLNYVREKAR
jgi:aconitate hydratase